MKMLKFDGWISLLSLAVAVSPAVVSATTLENALTLNRAVLGGPPLTVEGGVTTTDSGTSETIKVKAVGFLVPSKALNLEALPFEAIYLPDEHGIRLRLKLADADVAFFCPDQNGNLLLPVVSMLTVEPDGSAPACKATGLALGATALDFQRDPDGRLSAEWLRAQAIYNILANGNTKEYLRKHLNVFAGLGAGTIWGGSNEPQSADGTRVRMNVGIQGVLRSSDSVLELDGMVQYSPVLFDFKDFQVTGQLTAYINTLLFSQTDDPSTSKDSVLRFFVTDQYNYASDPAENLSDMGSLTSPNSNYIGGGLEIRF